MRNTERVTKSYVNGLAYKIIGCAIEVHKELGPGLLESVYEECLTEELLSQKFDVKRQVLVPITYKERELSLPLKLDIIVEDLIILELKAVEVVLPVHKAQLLSYMKLAAKPKGILINFHVKNITKGATHLVNELFGSLPV